MENYVRYSLMGAPTHLKKDVVPHLFDCDPSQTSAQSSKLSEEEEKMNRSRIIKEMMEELENKENHVCVSSKKSPMKKPASNKHVFSSESVSSNTYLQSDLNAVPKKVDSHELSLILKNVNLNDINDCGYQKVSSDLKRINNSLPNSEMDLYEDLIDKSSSLNHRNFFLLKALLSRLPKYTF